MKGPAGPEVDTYQSYTKPDTLLTPAKSISSATVPPAVHNIVGATDTVPTVGAPVQGGNCANPISSIPIPGKL